MKTEWKKSLDTSSSFFPRQEIAVEHARKLVGHFLSFFSSPILVCYDDPYYSYCHNVKQLFLN